MTLVCSDKIRHLRYEKLRKQLAEIPSWPLRYRHKIIGLNGSEFRESISDFERQFPKLEKKSCSLSRNGTYLSMTFELQAKEVDDIISLWVASEEVKDFVKIL